MYNTIFIILALLAIVVVLSIIMKNIRKKTAGTVDEIKICKTTGGVCCGGSGDGSCHNHTNKTKVNPIQYFEDEELDRYKGKAATDYTTEEVAEWEEIFATLRPEEVRSWVTSLHRRELHIPAQLVSRLQVAMGTTPQTE